MSHSNRLGSNHANWVNGLRSDFSREFANRREEEDLKENLVGPLVNNVERVHWYIKDNAKLHHTIKFDQIHDSSSPKPVFRRGQTFYVAMRFRDRDFDLNTDRIILNFRFGPKPSVPKDTLIVLPIINKKFTKTKDEWDVRIDPGTKGKDLVLQVFIPATAPVGIWRLNIRSGLKDRSQGAGMAVFKEETDVFILFNPWCKEDLVYLEDDKDREEYVMNDKGKVYVGSFRKPRGRPWAFGQFEDVVLPVACYVLELSKYPHSERGNPVKVVRAISGGVNDIDDEGILIGRWDGEYGDGVAPFKWTGSVRILEEYLKGGFRPVKYGQCWVFSAVTTTICRALGIPCRSVTNYVSAHDTNSSLTIDKFFSKAGDEIEGGPDGENWDSIWNFHVWNDVWMARPDLPPGYGGWQAIDATPQEESENKMQCGPASLEAVRRGDIGLGYDCPFVFAEVNADVMHWGEDDESDWGYKRMKMIQFHIGRSILTHKPGEEDDFGEGDKDDIITAYKNPEGSAAERLAIHNAIKGSKRAQVYYQYQEAEKEDVKFDLIDLESIFVGEPFKVKVVIRNESDEPRTVSAALTAKSIYYTGVHHSIIKKAEGVIKLEPQKEQEIALTVDYKEYWKRLQEHCMIKMYTICRVKETGQTFTEEDDFQVEKPPLDIEVPKEAKRGEACEVIINFTNPLDDELTDCQLSIDGSGLLRPRAIKIPGTVTPKGKFAYYFRFSPKVHGNRKIVASFNSKELFDISGTNSIVVVK
ncbi:UNVERIFIED_CONTAM: hypothetical protein RMT77_009552 [Armadillidium vulgare]